MGVGTSKSATDIFELSGHDGTLYASADPENPFHLKGINWFGSETYGGPPGGLDKHSVAFYLDFLQRNHFNAIRLLFAHEFIDKDDIVHTAETEDPLFFQTRYLEMFRILCREAAKRGILVMVAAHRLTHDAWPGKGLWFDNELGWPVSRVKSSWTKLAQTLCSEWNVVAADITNEPHGSSWGKGLDMDWNLGAEDLGNHVLDVCPRWLIFVEGVGYDPGAPDGDDPGAGIWWGENLIGARVQQVHLRSQEKLVYSPHVYGPSVYQQHYFDDARFPANMPEVWEEHFAFAQELTRRPIVLGEIGGIYTDQDRQWQDWAIPYLKQRGFGIFYFALNPDSDDTGGIVHKDWSLPVDGSPEAGKLAALAKLPSTDVFAICPACVEAASSSSQSMRAGGPRAQLTDTGPMAIAFGFLLLLLLACANVCRGYWRSVEATRLEMRHEALKAKKKRKKASSAGSAKGAAAEGGDAGAAGDKAVRKTPGKAIRSGTEISSAHEGHPVSKEAAPLTQSAAGEPNSQLPTKNAARVTKSAAGATPGSGRGNKVKGDIQAAPPVGVKASTARAPKLQPPPPATPVAAPAKKVRGSAAAATEPKAAKVGVMSFGKK